MPMETRVEDHTIHITGYVSSDAYEPLKEVLSKVSDKVVLSFDEKSFINSHQPRPNGRRGAGGCVLPFRLSCDSRRSHRGRPPRQAYTPARSPRTERRSVRAVRIFISPPQAGQTLTSSWNTRASRRAQATRCRRGGGGAGLKESVV